jgi:hypothetical protein
MVRTSLALLASLAVLSASACDWNRYTPIEPTQGGAGGEGGGS